MVGNSNILITAATALILNPRIVSEMEIKKKDFDSVLTNLLLFTAWLSSRGDDPNFETYDPPKLNNSLEIFYTEVKTATGQEYSKSSLVGLRAGINRHLQNPPYKRNISIMNNSQEFGSSNRMLFAVIKKLKQQGKDVTTHYPAISADDLLKIQSTDGFDVSDPIQLQEKCFFNIQLHFARRGRENFRNLCKSSFMLSKDDTGREFLEFKYHEKTKNHASIDSFQTKPRLYASEKTENCPLAAIKLYMAKLDPNCDILFTKAKYSKVFNPQKEEVWYTTKPLGINTIGNLMKNISKRLGLSQMYTNHSIRATCVTVLNNSGVATMQIMHVTGHRSESSLRSYNHDNSVQQKRAISDILGGQPTTSRTPMARSMPTCTVSLNEVEEQRQQQTNNLSIHANNNSNVSGDLGGLPHFLFQNNVIDFHYHASN